MVDFAVDPRIPPAEGHGADTTGVVVDVALGERADSEVRNALQFGRGRTCAADEQNAVAAGSKATSVIDDNFGGTAVDNGGIAEENNIHATDLPAALTIDYFGSSRL
jgi:hypothetical protein